MSHNHELEKQDLHPTTSEQNLELDNNELGTVVGGAEVLPPVTSEQGLTPLAAASLLAGQNPNDFLIRKSN